jgi:hypothetical protein
VRNPTAKPSTAFTNNVHDVRAPSASDRPATTAARGIGRDRNRSCTPEAASSATPAGAFIPVQRMVVSRNPGMRKST